MNHRIEIPRSVKGLKTYMRAGVPTWIEKAMHVQESDEDIHSDERQTTQMHA